MQQLASCFDTVNQKEDSLALGLYNFQQSQQESQQAYQQALVGYSNTTNSSLKTLGSEVAKTNTQLRELLQKPASIIHNEVVVPQEATNYISSSVDKQIVSSLSGIIGLLEKGIEDINSATKKLVEYKPPQLSQSPFGTVEEQAYIDNLVGGLSLKLDDSLKKY